MATVNKSRLPKEKEDWFISVIRPVKNSRIILNQMKKIPASHVLTN
jgi:23S rRNA A1618 N6-methylase RlmF